MRATIALLTSTVALVTALAASPAAAIGIAKTANPGWPSYYPNPDAAATQRFQEVYDKCRAFHRQYGEIVRVGGMNYSCP